MGAVVKLNGKEIKEVLAIVDTANNTATLETMADSGRKLDLRKFHIEVNIFGNMDMSLGERSLHGSIWDNRE